MADYIQRTEIKSVEVKQQSDITIKKLKDNFLAMLDNVSDMLTNEGPILSTWIKFQIGISNPIVFDSSSTNPKKNLIAQLEFNKTGAGVTNDFTITIQYDPFNYGQEDTDIIEKLDEYVANAMSFDFNTDTNVLRGIIQYGYNAASDNSLVSPEYTFFITDASTTVKFESGLSTYVFKGCSTLASDSDNVTKFPAITGDGEKLLDIVISVLYRYYGDKANKPSVGKILPNYEIPEGQENSLKYKIVVSEDCYKNCVGNVTVSSKTGMTPWEYCQALLDANPLTTTEKDAVDEDGNYIYANLAKLSYAQRPRYVMSIDDAAKAIMITHVVPKYTNENKTKLEASDPDLQTNYIFRWGKSNEKNLVVGWKPEVDTKLYLIRRARYLRAQNLLGDEDKFNELVANSIEENNNEDDVKKSISKQLEGINDDLNEMFDAQLQIIGIPADPPIGLELGVQPTIMQTVSRTSGIYMVNGATDIISSNGMYITTLKMFRLRGMDDTVKELNTKTRQTADEVVKQASSDAEDARQAAEEYSAGGGGYSAGGGGSGSQGGRWWPVVVQDRSNML